MRNAPRASDAERRPADDPRILRYDQPEGRGSSHVRSEPGNMSIVMTTIDVGILPSILRHLSHEIEFARGPGGSWFGVFTMQPLPLTDLGVRDLWELGLLDVLDWDEGPEELRREPDRARLWEAREVLSRTGPTRARLSTDGWAILDRN